jgi:hypothetical protein
VRRSAAKPLKFVSDESKMGSMSQMMRARSRWYSLGRFRISGTHADQIWRNVVKEDGQFEIVSSWGDVDSEMLGRGTDGGLVVQRSAVK